MSQKCDFCNEVKDDKDMEKESYQGKSICKECKEKEKERIHRRNQEAIKKLMSVASGGYDDGDTGAAGGCDLQPGE